LVAKSIKWLYEYDIMTYTIHNYYTFRTIMWPTSAISVKMDEYIVTTQTL